MNAATTTPAKPRTGLISKIVSILFATSLRETLGRNTQTKIEDAKYRYGL